MKILIINGPNLNLTGTREPKIYGKVSFDDLDSMIKEKYPLVEVTFFQSNHEGEIIDKIQNDGAKFEGLIINAGALTHTSIAIGDALLSIKIPKIEVHLSHIFAREEFRRKSMTAASTDGLVSGLGMNGYLVAIQYLFAKHAKR